MADETKIKGKHLLERLAADPNSGITLEDGLTKAQVDKLISDIDADYGRIIKGYTENIKDLTRENEGYKSDFAEVHKSKRESKAKELESETGVKASVILKYGGDTLEGMETYAKDTAQELGIKPNTEGNDGDKNKGNNDKPKNDAGDNNNGGEYPTDSNATIGTNDVDYSKMSGRQLIDRALQSEK